MIADLLKIINEDKYLPFILQIRFRCSAQFYVHKSLIRRHSKEVYIKLLDYLKNTQLESFYTGRAFEYIWHIIFTGLCHDII